MYSPSRVYMSDLPAPRSVTTVAALSSTEILVIGGWCDDGRVKSVYKGTLHVKCIILHLYRFIAPGSMKHAQNNSNTFSMSLWHHINNVSTFIKLLQLQYACWS